MPKNNRLFVALELPNELKEKIASELLCSLSNGVKKVSKENLHITLCFLGNYDQIRAVQSLSTIKFSKFNIEVNGVDHFFDNVIFVKAKSNRAIELAKKVNEALDVKNEKPFSAHITIARGRPFENKKFFEEYNKIKTPKISYKFEAKNFTLFESNLTPKGSVYKLVKRFDLV